MEYGTKEVAKLLVLSRATLRSLVSAGYVTPAKNVRGAWRFSFQDLVVLRTARSLLAAQLPVRRINRTLKALRNQLPKGLPLSGLSISVIGDSIVINDGKVQRQLESGQYLIRFEGDPIASKLEVQPVEKHEAVSASDWFCRGIELEESDPRAAEEAYLMAISVDSTYLDAYINLAVLLHARQAYKAAQRTYVKAISKCGNDALLFYNYGILLDDMGRVNEAIEAYQAALALDAGMADCHCNLGLLYESLGRNRDAIRHLSIYRKLQG
jgi:tetratricopeptide (TPR) repeat protein